MKVNKLDKFAQDLYLDCLCAQDNKWQQPEYINARWYHLLWLLIPIVGIIAFIEAVRNA